MSATQPKPDGRRTASADFCASQLRQQHTLCHPDGETDSEYALCHLLNEIAEGYENPLRPAWIDRLASLSEKISTLGKFNFLLSDGQELIAYGHDRLHQLDIDDANGRRIIIATEALGEGPWQCFSPGEMRMYRDGKMIARLDGKKS